MELSEFQAREGKAWWIIYVGGYGDFAFYGTSVEAEEMRRHKAQWEAGIGWKRLAGENEVDKKMIECERPKEKP